MKLLVVFAALVLAVSALKTDQWKEFKKTYGKTYRSLKEEKLRFDIFQSNVRMIEEHNAAYARGEKTYYMAINKFADLTPEEFQAKFVTFQKPKVSNAKKHVPNATVKAPANMDWRSSGAVLEVKNQGQCGGCWAFSVTGTLEGQNYLRRGVQISLSESELIDCSGTYGNLGCSGGWMERAFDYIKDNGLASEADYSYQPIDGNCRATQVYRTDVTVTGYVDLEESEYALEEAVANVGPISIAINANLLGSYGGGVLYDPSCPRDMNHAVLAVGYGNENGLDYWLIKNSWGADWGDAGYFKLARNQGQMCNVGVWSTYPLIA